MLGVREAGEQKGPAHRLQSLQQRGLLVQQRLALVGRQVDVIAAGAWALQQAELRSISFVEENSMLCAQHLIW